MGDKYTPVKGDRVRVVLEGEVSQLEGGGFTLEEEPKADHWCRTWLRPEAEFLVSVEKLEPPVVTFKPGDRVRYKVHPEFEYTLATNGYYDHCLNRVFSISPDFTSEYYELVNLVEAPF